MSSISNVVPRRSGNSKRVLIALLIGLAIAMVFWTQSRIPDLNTKAQMGQRTVITGIAFDMVLPVTDSQPVYERIVYTAVNWSYTNRKGMTFGILFAAAFIVFLAYLPRHEFRGQMLNTLKGVVTGVPLGVCVNCTTPIAQGMYHAGVRLETVLATLVSSPTLNVIVVTMSFSLLPLEFAVTKILGVIIFVLLVIPLVSRFGRSSFSAGAKEAIETQLGETPYRTAVIEPIGGSDPDCDIPDKEHKTNDGWLPAFRDVGTDYLRALWFVFRTMVPFMLLAGVLGAAVIEIVPVDDLVTLPNTILMVLLVAIIGVFLPVPIAFDVVIVSLLLASGVPVVFSMTLLFVLGIFSIYPFLILWRNVSGTVATGLFIGATVVGLGCGYGLEAYEDWRTARIIAAYDQSGLSQAESTPESTSLNASTSGPRKSTANEIHARNITIASDICNPIQNPMEQMYCFDDFMRSQFEISSDDSFCLSWPGDENQPVRDYCMNALQEKRIIDEAIASRDTSICASLPAGPKRFQCEQDTVVAQITTGADVSLCRQLPTEQQTYSCIQQGIAIRLDKFNDTDSCQQFDRPEDVAGCVSRTRVLDQAKGRRFENCAALENASEQQSCRRVVAFGMIDDGADISVCNEVSSELQRNACRAHAITTQAADTGNPDLCNAIQQVPEQAVCRRVANSQQITLAISKAAAQEIYLDIVEAPTEGASREAGVKPANRANAALAESAFYAADGVRVSRIRYRPRESTGQGFRREKGIDYGLEDVWQFSLLEFVSPFMIGRGIGAGDFNNDHLPDLVIASNAGVILFENTGDGRFVRHSADLARHTPNEVFVVALVDVDDDGWQDIFATSYGGRVSVILNDGAGFQNPKSYEIENANSNLATAAGFSDIDRDGDLDLMLGNWSFGEDKSFLENYSGNQLLANTPDGFVSLPLDEEQGDSLSVLFSDLNGDGNPDLAVANDREIPDMYFTGDGSGVFERIRPADKKVSATPLNSMSIDSADFNNDLRLDVFSTDMTFSEGSQDHYCDAVVEPDAAKRCRMLLDVRERINRRDTVACEELPDENDRDACLTAIFRAVVIDSRQPELCNKIPDQFAAHRLYCENLVRDDVRETTFSVDDNLPQVQRNVLLMGNPDGGYRELAVEYGVDSSFWTWNAKAADFDNDGWQDIYIGNGFRFGEGAWEIHSNVFFHNQGGESFETAQEEFGLQDFNNTPSYVALDFDFDGDLDIIATGPLSPPRVFVNQQAANNAISIAINDSQGNYFGVGAKVTIHYTANGETRSQLRELKASGGYMSFDAPIAHFGLGDLDSVSSVEIDWSTGGKTIINEEFTAGHHYVVIRE